MLRVVIDEDRCKGCALCTVACPLRLLRLGPCLNALGTFPAVIAPDDQAQCTSCAMCARMCPDTAIAVYREEAEGDR